LVMADVIDAATWRARLEAGAARLGVCLRPLQTGQLWQLTLLLRERNQLINLTSVDSLDGILTTHILDSLAVVPHLGDGRRIVDVGTGGGFPGLPLAVACPERDFVLIDGTQKKIRFVQDAIVALQLKNARAEAVRAERMRPEPRFDVAIVRAVGALTSITQVAGRLIDETSGRILAMKGKRPDAEIAALPRSWRAELIALDVPELAAERHLVSLSHHKSRHSRQK